MSTKSKSSLWQVFLLVRPFWFNIIGISLVIMVLSGINQFYPLINRSLIDLISLGSTSFFLYSNPTFLNLLILALLLKILTTVLNRISIYASTILGVKMRHYLREIGFQHLLELPVGYFNRNQSGQVMSKMTRGTEGIRSIVSNLGMNFLPGMLTAAFSVIVVVSINWQIGLASAGMFIPFYFLRLFTYRRIVPLDKKANRIWDKDYGHFWEVISNIRLVKTFGAENYELRKLHQVAGKLIANNYQIEKEANKGALADLLIEVWSLSIYAYIFYMGINGHFSIGTVVLLVQYSDMIKQPLWSLSWIFWEVKYAQVGVTDYMKIIRTKSDLVESQTAIIKSNFRGHIEFKNVWFKYPEKEGQEVFRGISFAVDPGKTLALVGRSGVGKTTIAHLLVRFFDPDRGSVAIDGFDLRDLTFSSVSKATGLVMQESFLYDDTIANNLRYGQEDATEADMLAACHVANAMEFINKLPKGLNTMIGERGVKLSGGQKQRLSIARTMLKNPKILILDEATSALDSHSEMLVQDALWKLIQGRTTIIIAHRLSTVQKADQIIVLDDKKIAETGTHQELIKAGGIYTSLHHIQSGHPELLKEWDIVS